jgi:hypothetical protein
MSEDEDREIRYQESMMSLDCEIMRKDVGSSEEEKNGEGTY